MLDSDAQSAIAVMHGAALKDSQFYCKFSVDAEGRLANLFWRDSVSLVDYTTFGDVLIFDSTYKTNIYKRPLCMFVGTNNHRATILYGCAILWNEQIDTYTWLLETFLESMNGKMPVSVLTDGDESMHRAIVDVFPNARHRICSWHIGRNFGSNLHDPSIVKDFTHLIHIACRPGEWETHWAEMVEMHGLGDKAWINMMFEKRDRWAEAFFEGNFFGGMTSTQRCEAMNKDIKAGINNQSKIFEILAIIKNTLSRIRNNVIKDDYNSRFSKPVPTTHMWHLERQVANTFTHDMYIAIKQQIKHEKKFIISRRFDFEGSRVYRLTQYEQPNRTWTVDYMVGETNPQFTCSCQLFQSDGIPCSHMFCVMKSEQIDHLPESLILNRWTLDARVQLESQASGQDVSSTRQQMARYASIASEFNDISYFASLSCEASKEIEVDIMRLKEKFEKYRLEEEETMLNVGSSTASRGTVLRDLVVAKSSKGKQAEAVRENNGNNSSGHNCTLCKNSGHNRRTCPKKDDPVFMAAHAQCLATETLSQPMYTISIPASNGGLYIGLTKWD
ncbi:hypothetical protein M0R45_035158 [Rubus argutus]|uniref:SWIM-type domain-containing protein n=1 Tax=Rubus argutus TaxID=59490 RepID=A0AAW1VT52_RUBAR